MAHEIGFTGARALAHVSGNTFFVGTDQLDVANPRVVTDGADSQAATLVKPSRPAPSRPPSGKGTRAP